MLIDKRYTYIFGYAGIAQYVTFNECEGKIVRPSISVSYSKVGEIPTLEGLDNIDDIIEVLKPHLKNIRLHLINSQPVKVYENTKANDFIDKFDEDFDTFIEAEALKYWEEHLVPIMKQKKWFIGPSHLGAPVLIHKAEDGEWDNISRDEDEIVFEYLCAMFVRRFADVDINLRQESGNWVKAFQSFICKVDLDYLIKTGYYIELD